MIKDSSWCTYSQVKKSINSKLQRKTASQGHTEMHKYDSKLPGFPKVSPSVKAGTKSNVDDSTAQGSFHS